MDAIYDKNVGTLLGISNIITSLDEVEIIHDKLIEYRKHLIFNDSRHIDTLPHYRGEFNYGWDIRPGTFRSKGWNLSAAEGKAQEATAAAEFHKVITGNFGKDALRQLFYGQQFGQQWDDLFQAQHAGIHTTIVDFSFRFERGLYFAVEQSNNPEIEAADGQFWAYLLPTDDLLNHSAFPTRDSYYDQSPMSLTHGKMINVPFYLHDIDKRVFESRMYKQIGRFYVPAHDQCNIPLNQQTHIAPWLFRFRIPAKYKPVIREELDRIGINRQYMYVNENPAHQALIDDINLRICGW